jgi:Fe-S cluster biogenesis protein NfuA
MCENCGCEHTSEHTHPEQTLEEQVKEIIENIRASLQGHGGDVQFVSIDKDNTVNVRLQGACKGCPGATMTMKMGIERILKERLPQVKKVVAVN